MAGSGKECAAGKEAGSQRMHRPEIYFAGPSLERRLGQRPDLPAKAVEEEEIPDFLKMSAEAQEVSAAVESADDVDSASSTRLFTEITLKNARFTP